MSGRRALLALTCAALCVVALAPRTRAESLEEQRRRLPPASEGCPDPIEGTWRGQTTFGRHWYRFDVRLSRVGASSYTAETLVHAWSLDPDAVTGPPACGFGLEDHTVRERGTAGFDGATLRVDSLSWDLVAVGCGPEPRGYGLDHFSGPLTAGGTEFHAVNTDDRNQTGALVFRRVSCGLVASPPAVATPPIAPRARTGCGC